MSGLENLSALMTAKYRQDIGHLLPPPFHGCPKKDSISSQQLVDRLEMAAIIGNWDRPTDEPPAPAGALEGLRRGAKQRCFELARCLQGKALIWYNTLDVTSGLIPKNCPWSILKDKFIQEHTPKDTSQSLCITLLDIKQLPREKVTDCYQ